MVLDVQRRTETVQDCGIGADSVKTGSLVIIDNKVSYLIENNRQKRIEVNDRSDFTHCIACIKLTLQFSFLSSEKVFLSEFDCIGTHIGYHEIHIKVLAIFHGS